MQLARKAKGNYVRHGGNCRVGQKYLNSIDVDDAEDVDRVTQLIKKIKSTSSVTPTQKDCAHTPGKRKVPAVDEQEVSHIPQL